MSGVTAAMLVVLGLAGSARAPDLQVEATNAAGASLPELTLAVARALVAGGARVVLKPPASEACHYCAKIVVIESTQGTCRVEVSQERHRAAATLHLPPGSPLLDRARAIAIQARLLVTWETGAEAKPRGVVTGLPARKAEDRTTGEHSVPTAEVAHAETEPPVAAPALEPVASPAGEPERRAASAEAKPPAEDRPAGATIREAPAETERQPLAQPPRAEPERARAMDLTASVPAVRKPLWPWIPTAIGASAAVAGGICALVARDRYDGLSDKTRSYDSARALKSEGEKWQLASFVLAGVAAAGVGTGVIGFATRSPVAVAAPVPGGGLVAFAGGLP